MNIEKKKVLITFAGGTDPLGKNADVHTDGPIIRICRFERPEKIYLILTEEMEYLQKDNIYQNAIESNINGYSPKIIPIFTGIKEAHLFDVYFDKINDTFEMAIKDNEDCEILVNLTSGTSQMTSNLLAYIVNSDNDKLRPVQVSSPARKSNYHHKNNYSNYDAKAEADKNIDIKNYEIDKNSNTRLEIPDLKCYKRDLRKKQIEELLKEYKYETCLYLLEKDLFSEEKYEKLKNLLDYSVLRKNLKGNISNNKLKSINNKKYNKLYYYPKNLKTDKIPLWYKVIDYFALALIKEKSNDISGYVLMLEPFIVNLYLSLIQDLGISDDGFFDIFKEKNQYQENKGKKRREEKNYVFNEKYFTEKVPELDKKLNESFSDNYRSYNYKSDLNLKALHICVDYFLNDTKIMRTDFAEKLKGNGITDRKEYIKNFKTEINNLYSNFNNDNKNSSTKTIKSIRNLLAHSLIIYDKEDFNKETQKDIDKFNQSIKDFFKKYFTILGYEEEMLTIYDDLNKEIINVLND